MDQGEIVQTATQSRRSWEKQQVESDEIIVVKKSL